MGSATLISPELTSDSSTSTEKWIADTACDFVAQICRPLSSSEKLTNHDDYLNRLQDEMNKIDAFKRELPLCMLLLRNAITRLKHEVVVLKESNSGPVLEEFLPLKKSTDEKIEDVVMEKNSRDEKIGDVVIEKNSRDEKMNWLSSVQLWTSGSQNHQSPPDSTNNKMKKKKNGSDCCNDFGFNESKDEVAGSTLLSLCTTTTTTSTQVKQETNSVTKSSSSRSGDSSATNVKFNSKSSQTARKQRRCWSPELHRRFVNALQKLGGAQAATPKQIRDHMQVDGLTNDEVKSHLQKYRLHTRRVPPPMANRNSNSNTTSTTFVGGFMMSKQQCSDTASIEEEDNISEIHNQ